MLRSLLLCKKVGNFKAVAAECCFPVVIFACNLAALAMTWHVFTLHLQNF